MGIFSRKQLPSYIAITQRTRITFRRALYLFHIASQREKQLYLLLIILIFGSGGMFLYRGYQRVTISTPAIGGVYIEGMIRSPQTINPIYASANDTDRDLARLIYSRLLTYDGSGNIIPDLAERFEVSDDQKNYTVFLHKNAKWHDGNSVTADDVVFTVRMIQDAQFKSVLRANWQGVEVAKIDDHTVRFALSTAYAPFVENLALGILPKHLWDKVMPEKALIHELNLKPIGSGPYRFSESELEKDGTIRSYTLERNDDYYRVGPYMQRFKVLFFEDEASVVRAWKLGEIDGLGPAPRAVLTEIGVSTTNVLQIDMPRIFGIFINTKHPVLSDIKIRQAIAQAIDRDRVATSSATGGMSAVSGYLPRSGDVGEGYRSKYLYDASSAGELFREKGWSDSDGDGILDKKSSSAKNATSTMLQFTLATSDWPDLVSAAEEIRKELREIGVDVVIESYSLNELEAGVMRPRKYDLLLFGQVYGYEADPFSFWHSSQVKDPGLNIAQYSNTKTDHILEEIRKINDRTSRAALYLQLNDALDSDLPAIFLFTQQYAYVLPPTVHGVKIKQIALPSDRFNEVARWYISTKRVFGGFGR